MQIAANPATLFRHCARHGFLNGIPISYLSRWLGALVDSNNADILRTRARPDGESCDVAVIQKLLNKQPNAELHEYGKAVHD